MILNVIMTKRETNILLIMGGLLFVFLRDRLHFILKVVKK